MGPGIRGSHRAHFSLGSPRARVEQVPIYMYDYFNYIYDYINYIYDYFDYIYDYFNYIYDYFLVTTSTTP
jgi:hypothetical protein